MPESEHKLEEARYARGSQQLFLREQGMGNTEQVSGKRARRSGCSLFPVPYSVRKPELP